MIIQFISSNKFLLDILNKNPHTDEGLYLSPLKNGIVIGSCDAKHQYSVLFQDIAGSYQKDPDNQLDFQHLCNPLIILHICTLLFNHLLKDRSTYQSGEIKWLGETRAAIDTLPCRIILPSVYIDSSWYKNGSFLLTKYFPGLDVQAQSGKIYRIAVQGASVYEAINLLCLTALFIHLTNIDALDKYIDASFAQKYVRILTNLEHVPYFVGYLFIQKAVKNKKQFSLIKPVLENYLSTQGISARLTHQSTQLSRLDFITEKIGTTLPVLDIGAGEFAYYKRLINAGFLHSYYAVDKDARLEKLAENIMDRTGRDNLHFFLDLADVPRQEKINIIMSEVIEHNELAEAAQLIKQALSFNFNQIIISTPNADFNPFYFSTGMRHEDHHFEMTSQQFREFLEEYTKDQTGIKVSFAQVGDELNKICPTQIAIIEKV